MRTIGINLHARTGLNDEEYLRSMAEFGFGATFTGSQWTDPKKLIVFADLCAKYGITYETMHAPFGHINDIWYDNEDGEAMLSELTACVDNCALAGVGIAVVHLSSGLTPPSITDIGRSRYEKLVDHAACKGVKIAFENQRMLANLSWALETFGPDVAGFCWDCGHENCFTPGREYMPLFADRLICTHIHDNDGVFNNDLHLIPFDGKLRYERVAEHLSASSYTGSLMLEVIASTSGRYEDISAVEYLEKAAAAARRLADMTVSNTK